MTQYLNNYVQVWLLTHSVLVINFPKLTPAVGGVFGSGYCVRNTPNFLLLAGILLFIASCMGCARALGIVKEGYKPTEPEQKPINNKFEEIREKYKRRLRERYRRR